MVLELFGNLSLKSYLLLVSSAVNSIQKGLWLGLFSISHVFLSCNLNVVFPKKVDHSSTTKAYSKGLHAEHELTSSGKKQQIIRHLCLSQ